MAIIVGFDGVGAPKTLAGSDIAAPFSWEAQSWNASGQVTAALLGGGTTTKWNYDAKSAWLSDIITQRANETIQNLHYEHDDDGNIQTRQDNVFGTTEVFQHDWLERTHQWTFTSSQGAWTTTYEYSDIGNIQSRGVQQQGGPSSLVPYFYGSRDAVIASTAPGIHAATQVGSDVYGYDPKGNQTTAPDRTIKYTSFNLPRTVTKRGSTRGSGITSECWRGRLIP